MKLLILTQTIDKNSSVLGFFHRWVEEFAKNCEEVIVICLQKGEYALPKNVRVFSLGKESGISRCKYLLRFYKYIWRERKNYDAVFVHMNQIYVILGGCFWHWWRKKIGLWYMHKSVTFSLRIAEKISQVIFTGSAESFRLKSKKLKIVGHGIDVDLFKPGIKKIDSRNKILMVGRISQTKKQLFLLKVLAGIIKKYQEINKYHFYFIGSPVTERDKIYEKEILDFIKNNSLDGAVTLCGSLDQKKVAGLLSQSRLLVNLSSTGSLDKDVLEAMSCNVPVITANPAFVHLIPEDFIGSVDELKDKILKKLNKNDEVPYREIIVGSHSLQTLIPKILSKY